MKREIAIQNKFLKKKKSLTNDMPIAIKAVSYLITTLLSVSCIIPFLLTLSISMTDEEALKIHGYNLIPPKFGFQAYSYILSNGTQILRSYGVTVFVTVVGTCLGLLLMTLMAYVISRDSFPWKKQFSFVIFFTMLFSGGMMPSYIINTTVFHLRDSIFALILPICMNAMYILILRTYMSTSIPPAVVESAKIDGAHEFTCYFRIVLPMAVPSIATIALFLSVSYWNNWMMGFLYILTKNNIMPIQLLLKRIENELEFLANNAGSISVTEAAAIRESIPGETIKMCLLVIVVVPILVAYPFFQKFFVKGITVGSVKG